MSFTDAEYQQLLRNGRPVLERDAQGRPARLHLGRRIAPAFDPFLELCRTHRLAVPEAEVDGLIPGRKFRVDYLFRAARLVIEKNGAIWQGARGGHSSGKGLLRDYEKLNLLTLAGYRVLFYTPHQLHSGACLPVLEIVLRLPASPSGT